MEFRDITNDTQTIYRLEENERAVFFMKNRSGAIAFELAGIGAEARVFAFFIGQDTEKCSLEIAQRHLSARTTSHVLVKSVLSDEAEFSYEGTIMIAKEATLSDASQENRNLLLSEKAKAFSKPALEILTNDVACHHAATTSPLHKEALFFAQARGLSPKQAETLLVDGFLRSSLDAMSALVSSEEQEKMLPLKANMNV